MRGRAVPVLQTVWSARRMRRMRRAERTGSAAGHHPDGARNDQRCSCDAAASPWEARIQDQVSLVASSCSTAGQDELSVRRKVTDDASRGTRTQRTAASQPGRSEATRIADARASSEDRARTERRRRNRTRARAALGAASTDETPAADGDASSSSGDDRPGPPLIGTGCEPPDGLSRQRSSSGPTTRPS
jgi:hypothetical protein